MEPEGSLPSSQELSTCTYPEPNQSSPQHSILFKKVLESAITLLILDKVTSRLVAPPKFIYSCIQASDVLVLTVRCKLINFAFPTIPLFIPEMSAGFTPYIVQVILIYFTRRQIEKEREY
jgi:hypothetical protein